MVTFSAVAAGFGLPGVGGVLASIRGSVAQDIHRNVFLRPHRRDPEYTFDQAALEAHVDELTKDFFKTSVEVGVRAVPSDHIQLARGRGVKVLDLPIREVVALLDNGKLQDLDRKKVEEKYKSKNPEKISKRIDFEVLRALNEDRNRIVKAISSGVMYVGVGLISTAVMCISSAAAVPLIASGVALIIFGFLMLKISQYFNELLKDREALKQFDGSAKADLLKYLKEQKKSSVYYFTRLLNEIEDCDESDSVASIIRKLISIPLVDPISGRIKQMERM